jgi:hypothetical protein
MATDAAGDRIRFNFGEERDAAPDLRYGGPRR